MAMIYHGCRKRRAVRLQLYVYVCRSLLKDIFGKRTRKKNEPSESHMPKEQQ